MPLCDTARDAITAIDSDPRSPVQRTEKTPRHPRIANYVGRTKGDADTALDDHSCGLWTTSGFPASDEARVPVARRHPHT